MDNSYLIETKDLVKIFPMGESKIEALNSVNLHFKKAEFAGLVGPSGSGKTTLLNILGSLDSPSEGSAIVMGQRIEDLNHKQGAELRNRHIGFIFQTFNLLPVYTVFENVEFPLACCLVGARPHSWFCYSWGYRDFHGMLDVYPEFARPLGLPKAGATWDAYTATREFAHASVRVDLAAKTARIDWR